MWPNMNEASGTGRERLYQACRLCPRKCGVNRTAKEKGFCQASDQIQAARAALYYWEEPCISGKEGSGTVFFTGCNLRCVFCQNYEISHEGRGKTISRDRLVEIFFRLQEQKANNINLVTADLYLPTVAEAIQRARDQGFSLPFVLNTSSYLTVDTLKMLEGLIDIYLSDFKYWSAARAGKYSLAADYPAAARAAIREMHRQVPCCMLDEGGMMTRGVIVRHLLMPGGLLEAKIIVKYLYETYGDDICLSLMNQYTPDRERLKNYPELQKTVREREYEELIQYALSLGVKNGYRQEGGTVSESFVPAFDGEGIL